MKPFSLLLFFMLTYGFAFSTLHADPLDWDRRPANEGGKRSGSQTQIDNLIAEINDNIKLYQSQHADALSGARLQAARSWAFEQWAANHHSDPLGKGQQFGEIVNLEVPSNIGVVDLDWLASIGNVRKINENVGGPIPYVIGKIGWVGKRMIEYKDAAPDVSSVLNAFPDTNWRAVAISDLLASGRTSVEEVFRPGHESGLVKQKRAELSTFFAAVDNWGWRPSGFKSPNAWTSPSAGTSSSVHFSDSRNERLRSLSPAPIGGISLAGACNALSEMGELEGFRFDESTGVLEILARTQSTSPDSRRSGLDDLVTVFRSVYRANGPSISINPDPQDPTGPQMLVVPDEITAGTWVQFVLLECDRIMKCYNLGEDNVLRKPISSSVAGYGLTLDRIFNGGEDSTNTWERFWITPARRRLFSAEKSSPHLFDIPLEVQTHRCILQDGRLVDAEADPSRGARAFTAWFTANFDAIGRESLVSPPSDSGVKGPVNVFVELKRIAAITAIAEYLQGRGVPMPSWMADYSVSRVTISPTTPSLTAHRSETSGSITRTIRLFGGVELGFSGRLASVPISALPVSSQAGVRQHSNAVKAKLDQLPRTGPLAVVNCDIAGAPCIAARLPLDGASDFGSCQLVEVDLEVPLANGRRVALSRYFNSITGVSGPRGDSWKFDLPRLSEVSLPVGRTETARRFLKGYDVCSADQGRLCRLDATRLVPELGVQGLVSSTNSEVLGLVRGKPHFWTTETRQLHLRGGDIWHFNSAGDLVATESREGVVVIFERDTTGRLSRIVGSQPNSETAEIRVTYDGVGRFDSAVATAGNAVVDSVYYSYGNDGLLREVRGKEKTVRYSYSGGRVVTREVISGRSALLQATVVTRYEYDLNGHLRSETTPEGDHMRTEFVHGKEGSVAHVFSDTSSQPFATIEYDAELRPKRTVFADASEFLWDIRAGAPTLIEIKDTFGHSWNAEQLSALNVNRP